MGCRKHHLEFTVNLLSRIQAKAAHCCDLFEQKPCLETLPPLKRSKLSSNCAHITPPNLAMSTFDLTFQCHFSGLTGG